MVNVILCWDTELRLYVWMILIMKVFILNVSSSILHLDI